MGIKVNINWSKEIFCFIETAKNGTISGTAEANGMKQSNLSKTLKSFEDNLHCQLLNRHHNGVSLTENGKEVYKIASEMDKIVYQIKNYDISRSRISGKIRLWTSDGLGTGYLSSCLPDFLSKYPDVKIEINCSLDSPDSVLETDMAIVYKEPDFDDTEIISRYDLKFGLFASMDYLSKFGHPKSIKDLQENHRICDRDNFVDVWPKWKNIISGAKHIVATTNSSAMMVRMTKDGIGIGLHPIGVGRRESDLIHISELDLDISHPFWIISHKSTQDNPIIKALIDHIKEATSQL